MFSLMLVANRVGSWLTNPTCTPQPHPLGPGPAAEHTLRPPTALHYIPRTRGRERVREATEVWAHVVAVPLKGQGANVDAVYGYGAGGGVIEALQQLDDGALAAA